MTRKKYAFLFIAICLLVSTSCADKNRKDIIIGVSQCSDDLWRQTMNQEMIQEGALYPNIEIRIKNVKDDTEQQINDINSFIDDKVDLLVVSPNESAAVTPIVQKAYKNNIPVILVDRKIDTDDYTAFIGADNYQIGNEAAHYIASILGGKGNIVEIRGWIGATSDSERHNGFIDGLKHYSDLHVVSERRGDFLKDVAESQMTEVLAQGLHIDLVFALNDPMASGAHNAFKRYGGKCPIIIGIDALPGEGGGIKNIENGIQDASFIYPTGGDKVIDLAYKILSGEEVEKDNILNTAVVDKSNIRVIRLQTEKVIEQQAMLKKMNKELLLSLLQYSNQKILFYGAIFALILISVSFFTTYLAYRAKSKTNIELGKSNEEIKEQTIVLEEQKRQLIYLAKELEEATQAKLVFFTNISHELKTPLTLILGPIETLSEADGLTLKQKELLSLARHNSENLLRLISQIIEFRSYENGKMQMFFSESNLADFICMLNTPFYDLAQRRHLSFRVNISSDNFLVQFDKDKIEKVYINLLSNAFKYNIPHNGCVEVTLSKITMGGKQYAEINVFNTGNTIPEEQIKNIFKRFYKVNPQDAGTGIGLALTSALVEMHNGKIDVSSEEGKGSNFVVTIPFVQHSSDFNFNSVDYSPSVFIESALEDITPEESDYIDQFAQDKPTILIIEDNADMRKYICRTLEESYQIIECCDGEQGINKAIEYSPDLVVSDVLMPHKNGFEVCKTLKENLPTSHIPIILLTACSLDTQKAIGFESGADAYISKPFNSNLLKIRIKKLIENRQKIKDVFSDNFINSSKKILLEKQEQEFIDKFELFIHNHISNTDLNIDNVAMHMGMSKSQLYRKVKYLTNYAPNELIKIIRLKFSKNILLTSNKSVSEVAYCSGFSSPSYFTKCFREFYDESPSDYINKLV